MLKLPNQDKQDTQRYLEMEGGLPDKYRRVAHIKLAMKVVDIGYDTSTVVEVGV